MALATFASSRPVREQNILSVLADISAAARHLNDLAEISLFVSKTEDQRSEIDLDTISFDDLTKQIFLELTLQASALGIGLHKEECCWLLHADPTLITMLFRFLIKSAIKYSRSGDRVTVTSRIAERGTEIRHEVGVAFTVPRVKGSDISIDVEALPPNAFCGEGFFQLNLTILFGKAVAASHSGEFFVTSEAGKTTLVLSIPASPGAQLS